MYTSSSLNTFLDFFTCKQIDEISYFIEMKSPAKVGLFDGNILMFSMQSLSENPLIATFQLSSAPSLNLGRSQNGVLGNGLKPFFCQGCWN